MSDNLVNWILVIVTGAIAFHALTYRDKDGERPWVHLLFGCIALLFCVRFLFSNVLGLI